MPSPPGAPEIIAIGKDFATIEWLKPENNGGSEITNYLIEKHERKAIRWTKVNRDFTISGTSFKVTGLQTGGIYQFRVMAINEAGDSEPSEVSLYAVCRETTCKW